jgi:hypothetical protein
MSRVTAEGRRKVTTLLMAEKMITWWSSIDSSAILVNGDPRSKAASPTALLSARMADGLAISAKETKGFTATLVWFCGSHAIMRGDPDAHPQGMMLHLVNQLLAQLIVTHPSFIIEPLKDQWNQINFRDVESVIAVFEGIVALLPRESQVNIVIDGVCHYEDSTRRVAMEQATKKLLSLTNRFDKLPCVKLLMTSWRSSSCLYKFFAPNEILSL